MSGWVSTGESGQVDRGTGDDTDACGAACNATAKWIVSSCVAVGVSRLSCITHRIQASDELEPRLAAPRGFQSPLG